MGVVGEAIVRQKEIDRAGRDGSSESLDFEFEEILVIAAIAAEFLGELVPVPHGKVGVGRVRDIDRGELDLGAECHDGIAREGVVNDCIVGRAIASDPGFCGVLVFESCEISGVDARVGEP